MAQTHTLLAGTNRPLSAASHRVRDIDPNTHIEVTVNLRSPDFPPASEMPAEAVSVEELARRYGTPPEDIRKVETTLESFGLRIEVPRPPWKLRFRPAWQSITATTRVNIMA